MKEFLEKISERRHLTREESGRAMRTIMDGLATDAQIAGFLTGMRAKGEVPDELLGFLDVMREKSVRISVEDPDAVDMCGTGGDGGVSFNISTVASFVVAGAGATVAKHGNRSVSSRCGSADLLKALHVNIELPPEKSAACINSVGIGFLFAPLYHPAMKSAAKARAELGVRTCFNLLGPMANPAGVRRQLVGAFSHDAAHTMASVFARLDVAKVFVVHAHDGLDEVSVGSPTTVYDVNGGLFSGKYNVDPSQFGVQPADRESIRGGTADDNAAIALDVLSGGGGTRRDVVTVNAAFGLLVAGKARTVAEGIAQAKESVDSGRARKKLNDLVEFSAR